MPLFLNYYIPEARKNDKGSVYIGCEAKKRREASSVYYYVYSNINNTGMRKQSTLSLQQRT